MHLVRIARCGLSSTKVPRLIAAAATAFLAVIWSGAATQAQTRVVSDTVDGQNGDLLLASPLSGPAAIDACLSAISDSERRYRIPVGLLLAIARTESGRSDPRTGRVQPWPWTVDVAGAGAFLPSAADAVRHVTDARQRGVTSIDTGCLQVNLQQHPDAFKTLSDAFEPRSNADYAARFLSRLHDETGDWVRASCFYHSHTSELAIAYWQVVRTHLVGVTPPNDAHVDPQSVTMDALKAAWGATLPTATPAVTFGWSATPASEPGRRAPGLRQRHAVAAPLLPASQPSLKVKPTTANLKASLLTGHCV